MVEIGLTGADERLTASGGPAGGAEARAVDAQMTRLRRRIGADPKAPHHLQTARGEG